MLLKKLKDVIDAEQFLRHAAEEEGLDWHSFCKKYGIIDESAERKMRRHESSLDKNA